MAKLQHPDHAGRMPGHPRYGNPSDENEESTRIAGAAANLEKWASKYGAEFSGGVSVQYGSGKQYDVGIGNAEIGQKIVSRPIETPKAPVELPPAARVILSEPQPPKQSWLKTLFTLIKEAFR